MTTFSIDELVDLLNGYRFDLESHRAEFWVSQWFEDYDPVWVRLAIIEALYRGRYKAVSVDEMLKFWTIRGETMVRFNADFETLILQTIQTPSRDGGIHQFQPSLDPSELYDKLKAIAHPETNPTEENNPENSSENIIEPQKNPSQEPG